MSEFLTDTFIGSMPLAPTGTLFKSSSGFIWSSYPRSFHLSVIFILMKQNILHQPHSSLILVPLAHPFTMNLLRRSTIVPWTLRMLWLRRMSLHKQAWELLWFSSKFVFA
jgi:hypothetical protein